MAGRDSHFVGTKTLPAIKVRRTDIRKTRKAMKYKTFAKPLTLPSIELMSADLNDVSTLFSKKQLCKKVSEWFSSWRPWQQRILLCSMTEKCSKSQLQALITTLEPVFHRDFVSELRGSYPTNFLRPKFVHTISSFLGDNNLRTLGVKKDEMFSSRAKKNEVSVDERITKLLGKQEILGTHKRSKDEEQSEACYHDIALEHGVEFQHVSEEEEVSFAVSPAVPVEVCPPLRHEHAPRFNKLRKVSTRNFFPDNTIPRLGIMKSVRRTGDNDRVYGKDPGTFKCSKWWEGHQGSKLVRPRRSRLAKFFKSQLNQINQWLDEWESHERVDMLSEVLKCCDPGCLNFFALCLRRRLKDQIGVDSIPDALLRKVFSYLDVKSLCQTSQVCHRWRFLSQDSGLWKRKVRILGANEGIGNLPLKIVTLGKGQFVDWKQAYQEVKTFYKQLDRVEESEEIVPQEETVVKKKPVPKPTEVKPAAKSPDVQPIVKEPPKERVQPQAITSGHGLIDISVVEAVKNMGCVQTPATVDLRICQEEFERKAEDKNDLTGGNLKMLAKGLRALMREKDREPEDIALDVRPSLIQATNLLDSRHTKFRYISLAVQGVLAVQKVKRLQGHMDGVLCLQFDLKRVITGSADRTIRVWDVRSGRSIRKIKGHKGGVRCLQFDNTKIVSGSWDMTIMVWHIVKFERLQVLYGHKGCVSCLKFDEHFLVSGSHDSTIRVWDTTTWECIRVIQAHNGVVMCLEFEGQYILSGSLDKTIKLWDIHTAEILRVFKGHNDGVTSVLVVGSLMISGSDDGMMFFWDTETGHCEAAIQAHEGPVHSISAPVSGEHFLSSGGDNLIKEWDMATCTCLRTLQGHRGPVLCVKTNPRRILSCSSDGTVRIWDLEKRNPNQNVSVEGNAVDPAMVRGAK